MFPISTTLEKSKNIREVLLWKIEAAVKDNLPIEAVLADYVSLAVDNLEKQVSYTKDAIKEYQSQKKEIEEQIKSIKIDGAEFFNDNGIVRIDGIACSSITVNKGKEESETEEEVEEFTILCSNEEIEELLIGLGKAEMRKVIKIRKINSTPPSLRINKRNK